MTVFSSIPKGMSLAGLDGCNNDELFLEAITDRWVERLVDWFCSCIPLEVEGASKESTPPAGSISGDDGCSSVDCRRGFGISTLP